MGICVKYLQISPEVVDDLRMSSIFLKIKNALLHTLLNIRINPLPN